MRKYMASVLALVCVLGLIACSGRSIGGIEKATKIEVVRYNDNETVSITEEASVEHIVDNLNSLQLKKMEYNKPTSLEYKLTFYNSDGDTIETITIPAHDWVGYEGYFHSITSGKLDRAYIAGLFE